MPKYKSILQETKYIGWRCCKCGETALVYYSDVKTKNHLRAIFNLRKIDTESQFYGWTLNKKDEACCNKCTKKNKK